MQVRRFVLAVSALFAIASGTTLAHEGEQLGTVTFQTSCDPKVQALLNSAVAIACAREQVAQR